MDEPTTPDSGLPSPEGGPPVPQTTLQEAAPFPSTVRPARLGRRAGIAIAAGAVAVLGLAGLGIHLYLDRTHTTYIPASKPVAAAGIPQGWSQYREPKSGFAVQLPPGWSSIGVDVLANKAVLEAKYPQFAAKLKQYGDISQVATKVKFYAEDAASQGSFVIIKQSGNAISMDDYLPIILPAFDKLGAQQLEHHRVTLPAGEAERFGFTLTITDTQLQLRYVQYHLLRTSVGQTTLFVMQFIVAADATDPSDETIDQVARSLTII